MKLFLHMPKCAGTSVLNILENKFEDNIIKDYDSFFKIPQEKRNEKIKESIELKNNVPEDKIVYGHFFPVKYLANYQEKTILVTILREPIERLKSHYKFWNLDDFSEHYLWRKMKEKNWTFEEFALCSEMQNFYSQYFTGIKLSDFTFIGIYENLDYSIEKCLLELDVKFDKKIPHLNVTENNKSINLDIELIEKIKKFHSKDYEIYEYAANKFHKKNIFEKFIYQIRMITDLIY